PLQAADFVAASLPRARSGAHMPSTPLCKPLRMHSSTLTSGQSREITTDESVMSATLVCCAERPQITKVIGHLAPDLRPQISDHFRGQNFYAPAAFSWLRYHSMVRLRPASNLTLAL